MPVKEIKIEKLISDGRGLGRDNGGMVWMAPYTVPGELVRLRELRRRSGRVDGRCVEVLEASPLRTRPLCPFFGECGGCRLQHLEYRAQFRFKAEAALETLGRQPLLREQLREKLHPEFVVADRPFGYRQRVRLLCDRNGRVGFRERESHRLAAIDRCLLASAAVGRVVTAAAGRGIPEGLSGLVRELLIEESPADGQTFVTLICARRPRPRETRAAAGFIRSLAVDHGFAAGRGFSRMTLVGDGGALMAFHAFAGKEGRRMTIVVEPGGFCQVNQEQNRKLVRTVCGLAGRDKNILDLFCGAGNFSIPLALVGNRVTGCDMQRAAIRAAEKNRESAGTAKERLTFFRGPADELFSRTGGDCDILLVDPPRSGFPGLATGIGKSGAARLIYVSCNPATLARDLAAVCAAQPGWRLVRLVLIDMFPQTSHLETVAVLER